MTARSHTVIAVAGAMIVLIIGAATLVWPNDQRARAMREDMMRLRESAMASPSVTARLEGLAHELQRLRRQRLQIARTIPPIADVDHLMGAMERSLEGQTVYGPTVRPGAAGRARPDSELSEQTLPVQVDLDASLDSIFNLLHGVESMDRLVRVSSVRAEADRLGDGAGSPMLTATIGLQLVFDPPPEGEGF